MGSRGEGFGRLDSLHAPQPQQTCADRWSDVKACRIQPTTFNRRGDGPWSDCRDRHIPCRRSQSDRL